MQSKKANINKVMTEKCQHRSTRKLERLLALLWKFKYLFSGTLGIWNTTPVYLELRYDSKPV